MDLRGNWIRNTAAVPLADGDLPDYLGSSVDLFFDRINTQPKYLKYWNSDKIAVRLIKKQDKTKLFVQPGLHNIG